MKLLRVFCLLFLPPMLYAQAGTFTVYTTTFQGLHRQYGVYVPPTVAPNPVAIFLFPGTCPCLQTAPPLSAYHGWALDRIADEQGFLVVEPMATWVGVPGKQGRFFWHSYGTDPYFPNPPDDSGFLRWLFGSIAEQYGTSAEYPMGMSSGGMMVERFCNENADLVTACAVMSGSLYVGSAPVLPAPSRPVSIRFERGSADPTIGYCGAMFVGWGSPGPVYVPSVDVDLNYWLAIARITPYQVELCPGGKPGTAIDFNFQSPNGANVQFHQRIGGVHDLPQWEVAEAIQWLLEH
jgi:poly(3-hydroxybutyrate) depolymerase